MQTYSIEEHVGSEMVSMLKQIFTNALMSTDVLGATEQCVVSKLQEFMENEIICSYNFLQFTKSDNNDSLYVNYNIQELLTSRLVAHKITFGLEKTDDGDAVRTISI